MVAFSMCLGSLYTQTQIANFILRSLVLLKSESSPSPAGWSIDSPSYGFKEYFLIYR
jgi:hypothetical protein